MSERTTEPGQVRIDAVATGREGVEVIDDLERFVAGELLDVEAVRVKEDQSTQDFGATLVLLLGTTGVTALAQGIATWLARRSEAEVRLSRIGADGSHVEVVVGGRPSAEMADVVREFLRSPPPA